MSATGWTGEGPDGGQPLPMAGYAGFLASVRPDPDAGRTMEQIQGGTGVAGRKSWYDELGADKSGDRKPDGDERAAGLLARHYQPGHIAGLAQRYADTVTELEAERDKMARGARLQALAAREHAAGRIGAWDIQRMLDGDHGDPARAERLERRAASLRHQLGDAQATVTPPQQREADAIEAAGRHAHQVFTEVTRERLAAAAGAPRQRAPRPFASRAAGGEGEPDCAECAAAGASAEESFLIHADPDPAAVPPGWQPSDAETGRSGAGAAREITR